MSGSLDLLAVAAFTGFVQIGVWVLVPVFTLVAFKLNFYWASAFFALYAISYLDGAEFKVARNRTWPQFSRRFWLFTFFRRAYQQRVHLPPGFNPPQFILALHPHGAMADFRVLLDGQLLELLGDASGKVRWLAASVLFRLPIVRELCLWTGCVDARRQVAEQVLARGLSIGVLPGGELEQVQTQYGREAVYLKKRLGFVKLALRYGVPLVPAYVFGCVDLYKTSKWLYSARLALVRTLGVAIPLCWGAFGLPLTPLRQPVNVVIGEPLDVGHRPQPTDEEVVAAHAKYMRALQQLFDANKGKFGCADRTLEVG